MGEERAGDITSLICQRVVLPSRRVLAGWKSQLAGISYSSTEGSSKLCWRGTTNAPVSAGDPPVMLCRKGAMGIQVDTEMNMSQQSILFRYEKQNLLTSLLIYKLLFWNMKRCFPKSWIFKEKSRGFFPYVWDHVFSLYSISLSFQAISIFVSLVLL